MPPPTPRPPAPPLTVEKITATTRAIVRDVGVDGLTMRLLANRLGVTVAATYRHVPDKHTLLTLVLDTTLANIEVPHDHEIPALQRLASITRQSFREIINHPGLDVIVLRCQSHTPHTRRLSEASVALLVEAGLDLTTAKHVEETRHRMWLGSIAVATTALARLTTDDPTGRRRASARARAAAQLEFAIDLLEAGIRTMLVDQPNREPQNPPQPKTLTSQNA